MEDRPSSSPASEAVAKTRSLEDEQRPPETAALVQKLERDPADQTHNHAPTASLVSEHPPRMAPSVESSILVRPSSLSSKQDPDVSRGRSSRVSFDMAAFPYEAATLLSEARAIPHDHIEIGLEDSIEHAGPTSSALKWQRILKLREDNWGLRSQVQEIRNNLRQKQYIKSAADDMLVKRINVLTHIGHALSRKQKTLEQLQEECQNARDAYGPLEDECNRLEDQLSRQEFKLTQLEKDFYGPSAEPPVLRMEQPQGSHEPEIRYAGTSSITSQEDEIEDSDYHPLVTKYLSKLGDLDLHRERLDEIVDEKVQLEEERDSRLRFGLMLDPDDQTWLDNSHKELHELSEKIRLLEKELEDMKQDCISKGLVDEYGEPTSFQWQEQGSFNGEEDMNPQDEKSEYVKYPALLPHPGILKHEDCGNYEPKPDERSDTTTTRINKWMLEKLRCSPLDVNLLARTFEGVSGQTHIYEGWQFAVLDFWYRDGTLKTRAGFHVYPSTMSRSMNTQAAPEDANSESPDSSPEKSNKDPSFRILVASSLRDSSDRSDATQVAFFLGNPPDSPISPRHKTLLEK